MKFGPSAPVTVIATILAIYAPAMAEEPMTDTAAFWAAPTVDGGKCCKTLGEVRANIDRIDRELVRLMAERGKYVHEAGRFKKNPAQVEAPERAEAAVQKAKYMATKTASIRP